MTSDPSFSDRVAAGYAGLSPQLRRAADFVAANGQEVATRSLRQVSVAAGVTPPTLSRLARALGFDSYEALRELAEGTGIAPDQVEIIPESGGWLPYDLPRHLVPKLWGGRFRGQKQRWFAIRFHGADADVNIATDEPEFRVWTWMAHDELIDRIVPFKRDTYTRVFAEFADLF